MTDYLAQLRTLDLDVQGGLDLLDAADRAERIARDAVDLSVALATEGRPGAEFYAALARIAAGAADAMRAAHRWGFDAADFHPIALDEVTPDVLAR